MAIVKGIFRHEWVNVGQFWHLHWTVDPSLDKFMINHWIAAFI